MKREHIRVQLRVLIKGGSKKYNFFANSKDISIDGIKIESDKVLVKGERVSCSFFLDGSQVEVLGDVVRAERREEDLYDYGLKFINLDPISRDIIEKFIEKSTKNLKSVQFQSP